MSSTVQAEWGGFKFGVVGGAVRGIATLARTRALKAVQQADINGSASVATRGMEPFTATLNWTESAVAGGSVRDTLQGWEDAIGQSDYLLVGGSRWYSEPLRLMGVSASEIVVDTFGRLISATITVSFSEQVAEQTVKRKSTAKKKRTASPAIFAELGTTAPTATADQKKAAVEGGKIR